MQNLQAFLNECKARLGLTKEHLLDPSDVFALNPKGIAQVGARALARRSRR